VLIRFERMRGKSVLWQVGMDHAGIATQMVVERKLAEDGNQGRRELGRKAFVKKIWEWKAQSGGTITRQLRRLGASCDWTRERFTLDEGLSAAVRKVFVQLYKEGLIYRAKRMVNWDPYFQTAISDLEVENREVQGHFWHFKYPLENGETYEFPIEYGDDGKPIKWETRNYISIATTRPETMLGDGAVAVHPDDERYAPIVGKRVLLPLADRYIPIITDEHPDPELGSGAVKITGAHDFNDYEVAKRHDLPMHIIMDERACMLASDIMPEKYVGLKRFADKGDAPQAREQIIADIDKLGLLEKVEDKVIQQPTGDRSNVAIEPMLTHQWFVDAKKMAVPALAAVKDGTTKFTPKNWENTYFHWMNNIQPWCVSRQLWWGHRIPVWYGWDVSKNGLLDVRETPATFVAESEDEAVSLAKKYYGEEVEIKFGEWRNLFIENEGKPNFKLKSITLQQDPDVLDTWFSSALWPFSTLGWPDKTPELDRYYPTNVLITGHDIIFFWVARMMMQGLHFTDQAPFPDVYIHGLVLDEHGKKMSKSKGNTIDPLDIIDRFGADALRFTMTISAAQGTNIRMSESRVEGYRNFGTKLWNAARFCQMNDCVPMAGFDAGAVKEPLNRWIIAEAASTAQNVTRALEGYRFNDAAQMLYRFVWNTYCDWYLELIKPLLNGEDEVAKAETRASAAYALDQALIMLHPIMPYITEKLWGEIAKRETLLITAPWPAPQANLIDEDAQAQMDWVIRLITAIRSVRAETNVPAGAKMPLVVCSTASDIAATFKRHGKLISRLARVEKISFADEAPEGALQTVIDEVTYALIMEGAVDMGAERKRLQGEITKTMDEISRIQKKLGNEKFTARAPAAVVDAEREKLKGYQAQKAKLEEALARLS
ncbi:MAG: valine--tRNA ligase, partial [Robiginitomaculum sp.]